MFVHAKKLYLTGKTGERIVRGQKNVRFFKTDLSGKCDSIHSDQKRGLTQLINKPILWNFENQLTGDVMHLIGDNKTEKLDSLKVLNNTFIISKDTIGDGFNQIKGLNLYGKFLENKLHEIDVVKNTEVVYYMRNDKNELIGINKNVSSKINMIMDDKSKVETITFFNNVDGDIYPEKDLPENARKLRGFVWRGDERIKTKEDIFPEDEVELDKKIVEESKANFEEQKNKQEATDINQIISKIKPNETLVGQSFISNIDAFENSNNVIKASGWAFFSNQSPSKTRIIIVLLKDGKTTKLNVQKATRPDVIAAFKLDYNNDECGFNATIDSSKLKKGNYQLAVYLKNEETNKEGLLLTDKKIDIK